MPKITTPAMEKFQKKNKNLDGGMRRSSLTRDAWLRLKRNRTAVVGLGIISVLALAGILAPLLTRQWGHRKQILGCLLMAIILKVQYRYSLAPLSLRAKGWVNKHIL